MDTQLLTATEAARRLRVTYGTLAVWRCTHRKNLPYVRFGRKIYYRSQDLETFITEHLNSGLTGKPQ
jgi:excisionase family DNA binding protein